MAQPRPGRPWAHSSRLRSQNTRQPHPHSRSVRLGCSFQVQSGKQGRPRGAENNLDRPGCPRRFRGLKRGSWTIWPTSGTASRKSGICRSMRHAGVAATLLLLAISGDRPFAQAGPGGIGAVDAVRRALDEGYSARTLSGSLLIAWPSAQAGERCQAGSGTGFRISSSKRSPRRSKIGGPRTLTLAEAIDRGQDGAFRQQQHARLASSLDNLGALSYRSRGILAKGYLAARTRPRHPSAVRCRPNDRGLAGTLERLTLPRPDLARSGAFPEKRKAPRRSQTNSET